jgi:hypothetical protein
VVEAIVGSGRPPANAEDGSELSGPLERTIPVHRKRQRGSPRGALLENASSSSQPVGSLVAALVAEQNSADHSGALLRFVHLITCSKA